MSNDQEERRQQDLRDLEFYRKRIRLTSSDLWRVIENSHDRNVITELDRQSRENGDVSRTAQKPVAPPKPEAKKIPPALEQYSENLRQQATKMFDPEVVLPIAITAFVLVVLSWTGQIDKILSALIF